MASCLVKTVIATAIERTPAKTTRSSKLRNWAQEILVKSCQEEESVKAFEDFSSEAVRILKDLVLSVTGKYKLHSYKREYLWKEFHLIRGTGKLSSLWSQLTSRLKVSIDDTLLEQSVFQELFEASLKEHYTACSSPHCG